MVRDKRSLGDIALIIAAALAAADRDRAGRSARRVAVPSDAGERRVRGLLPRADRAGGHGRGLDVDRLEGGRGCDQGEYYAILLASTLRRCS